MSNSYKAALVIILVIALIGTAFVLLSMRQEEMRQETFEEFDETYIYVDKQGNAMCQSVWQLSPSRLADSLKSAVLQIGTSVFEREYSESVKRNWAKYGSDAENIACIITGLAAGENLKITITWEVPNIAKRKENRWTISFDWVDNQSVAQDTIAALDSALTITRNFSKNANYYVYAKTTVILPDGAENVGSPQIGASYTDEYGGGYYSKTSFYTEESGGKIAIIENSMTLFSAKNDITLTVEQLLENIVFQIINYDGAFPTDNLSFINSIGRLRLDLKYGRELDERYSIFIGRSEYYLSPAQLLYYAADAIIASNQGSQFSISQPTISVTGPSSENGDIGAFWGSLSKTEYVSLAQQIRDNLASTGIAPSVITSSRGQIRFRDALLTFIRILSTYEDNGALPDSIVLAPSPSGQLSWKDISVPANYAYFLLPDSYAITDTSGVNEVLDDVYQPSYDNRMYANALFDWAHANITYTLIITPPTSEWVLTNKLGQCRDYTNVCLALLRTAGIPTKRMTGWIVLTGPWSPPASLEPFMKGETPDGRIIGSHAWNKVYLPDEGWTFADATWGYFENAPYEIYQQQEQTWLNALAGYETVHGVL